MKNILTIVLSLISLVSVSQNLSIPQIKAEVKSIDQQMDLKHVRFDANEVYEQNTNGLGTFEIWAEENKIRKISQKFFLPNGRFMTTIYLRDNQPILILETEKHPELIDDPDSLKHDPDLKPDYEEVMYTYNWDKDPLKVETEGKSLRTEAICGISDYSGMLEIAEKLLAENPSRFKK